MTKLQGLLVVSVPGVIFTIDVKKSLHHVGENKIILELLHSDSSKETVPCLNLVPCLPCTKNFRRLPLTINVDFISGTLSFNVFVMFLFCFVWDH